MHNWSLKTKTWYKVLFCVLLQCGLREDPLCHVLGIPNFVRGNGTVVLLIVSSTSKQKLTALELLQDLSGGRWWCAELAPVTLPSQKRALPLLYLALSFPFHQLTEGRRCESILLLLPTGYQPATYTLWQWGYCSAAHRSWKRAEQRSEQEKRRGEVLEEEEEEEKAAVSPQTGGITHRSILWLQHASGE